jgi:hypothetical protein
VALPIMPASHTPIAPTGRHAFHCQRQPAHAGQAPGVGGDEGIAGAHAVDDAPQVEQEQEGRGGHGDQQQDHGEARNGLRAGGVAGFEAMPASTSAERTMPVRAGWSRRSGGEAEAGGDDQAPRRQQGSRG